MKNFQRLCAALVLAFVLASPALAGDMDTGFTSPPPQPATSSATTSSMTNETQADVAGDMATGGGGATASSSPVAEAALGLLASALSLV
jgi:hypothetical protein